MILFQKSKSTCIFQLKKKLHEDFKKNELHKLILIYDKKNQFTFIYYYFIFLSFYSKVCLNFKPHSNKFSYKS